MDMEAVAVCLDIVRTYSPAFKMKWVLSCNVVFLEFGIESFTSIGIKPNVVSPNCLRRCNEKKHVHIWWGANVRVNRPRGRAATQRSVLKAGLDCIFELPGYVQTFLQSHDGDGMKRVKLRCIVGKY